MLTVEQARKDVMALGEWGWSYYENRLWQDIPGDVRDAMVYVRPARYAALRESGCVPALQLCRGCGPPPLT